MGCPDGKTIGVSGDARLPRHARDLVERGWTQGADARAADDTVVHPCDARAVSWSLLGALVVAVEEVAAREGEQNAIGQLARTCSVLADILDTDSLVEWNDVGERIREDVVAAFDRVAAEISAGADLPGSSE